MKKVEVLRGYMIFPKCAQQRSLEPEFPLGLLSPKPFLLSTSLNTLNITS